MQFTTTSTTEHTPGPIDNMREHIKDQMGGKVVSQLKTASLRTTPRPKVTTTKNQFRSKFSDFSPPPRRKRPKRPQRVNKRPTSPPSQLQQKTLETFDTFGGGKTDRERTTAKPRTMSKKKMMATARAKIIEQMNAELHSPPMKLPPASSFEDLLAPPPPTEATPSPMNRMLEARDRLRMLMGKKPLGPRTTTTQKPTPSTEPPMTKARMKVLEKLSQGPAAAQAGEMTNPFAPRPTE